jgi:hypothetical protein
MSGIPGAVAALWTTPVRVRARTVPGAAGETGLAAVRVVRTGVVGRKTSPEKNVMNVIFALNCYASPR